MDFADRLELHYIFLDNSHSLDAYIRNKCEADFLAILKEISNFAGIHVHLESSAFEEGGLRETWQFLGKNSGQIAIVIALLTLILTRFPVIDKELVELQKRDLELSIEEKMLKRDKLREALKEVDPIRPNSISEEVLSEFDRNHKIVRYRSNFYDGLISAQKITQIEAIKYSGNNPVDTITVHNKDFARYIVAVGELPDEKIEGVLVEIISPVLRGANHKWKGVLDGKPIEFYMKDKAFKDSVAKKDIVFKAGFTIECVLNIKSIIDEAGEIKAKSYSVITVISIKEESGLKQTIQGRSYLEKKHQESLQGKLF